MFKHIVVAAAMLGGSVAPIPTLAQEKVPAALAAFKPHEIVEAFTAEAKSLGLTQDQLARFDSLHLAVRDERHRWEPTPGNKAHQTLKMKPMISRQQAYTRSLAILTATQREAIAKRFTAPGYVPMVPSLASEVPASLASLKPHEIVQVVAAEGPTLGLSQDQVKDLQELHVAVRDEAHRYSARTPASKAHNYEMMEPMISKRRAYNDALSILTPEQREGAYKRFNAPGYKPPAIGTDS